MQKELDSMTAAQVEKMDSPTVAKPATLSPEYWRSIDQLNETPEYTEFLQREFPQGASELADPVTRRNFMKIMSASVALAGLASCRMPKEKIISFVKSPENVVPGKPKFYASTMTFADHSYGVLVESHEGRPTKIEGNDMHPASLGSTHPWALASVLSLYDQDRSKTPMLKGAPSSWNQFEQDWTGWSESFGSNQGKGLAVVSETISSPSAEKLVGEFRKKYPNALWATYEPISQENVVAGVSKSTGKNAKPVYQLVHADIVVAVDSDFFTTEPNSVRYTKDFSKRRRVEKPKDEMNRLYSIESSMTATGAMADHRLTVASSRIPNFLLSLYTSLQNQGVSLSALPASFKKLSQMDENSGWIRALAKDLKQNMGRSAILVGSHQSPAVHALVLTLNTGLGNIGKTVVLQSSLTYDSNTSDLKMVSDQIDKKQISTLLILGGNPAYNAPSDFHFADRIKMVAHTAHFSTLEDETSALCEWHLPMSHYLETWSDAKTLDGTTSIVQPLIRPLYDSRNMVEILTVLVHQAFRPSYDTVVENWKGRNWDQTLHDGVLKNSSDAGINAGTPNLSNFDIQEVGADQIEVTFTASPSVFDGRFANNGWLQELPQPITKMTWDNPALISPALAKQYGLKNGQFIQLKKDNRVLEIPVWIVPGQAKNSISLHLGFGRAMGTIAKNKGFNTYTLRTSTHSGVESGFTITALSKTTDLACTQDHGSMEGRPIVREATREHFEKHPDFVNHAVEHPPLKSLWTERLYNEGYQWGMVIDLNTCTGCNACVTACQSENNIPIVGKTQVLKAREMHWIRIDRYFSGNEDEPMVVYQPMTCQHCENAPCEQVCPVNATVHDKEGLNTMVYNRCIGTRYCSNNCPYKVRRFNFFNFTKDTPLTEQMANNPDVTIRFRGVMEKCTYCIQRINHARHESKQENRTIRDGEIRTACQQACPADAIVFGNVNDPNSRVSQMKKFDQNYAALEELNIKPRTTYLAKIRNPNPEIKGAV